MKLFTSHHKLLADTLTPVSVYLKIRDNFQNPILLESSDYHSADNSLSFLAFEPLAEFKVENDQIFTHFFSPLSNEYSKKIEITDRKQVLTQFNNFIQEFETEKLPFNFPINGLFGYSSYDAVRYFEDLEIKTYQNQARKIPDMCYRVYRFVVVIHHFNNEMYVFEHIPQNTPSKLQEVVQKIQHQSFPTYPFRLVGEEKANMKEEDFAVIVDKAKSHCRKGDVFQMVLSRQFSQAFQGDDFQLYRSLRSINPSPYLFYFDYGNFKIFGSSPEAQLVIKNKTAEIHPIAGTFRRTGNDTQDAQLAEKLAQDEKETAEHIMLVDLARNDLSRHGRHIKVDKLKEIQYYSHLIHLVSKVTAQLSADNNSLALFGDTFPAGTLSGAPKYKAMQLINEYEPQNRGFYGGAIGWLSFEGELNHAIMIRSFLSKENILYYQAGAGVVAKSNTQSEVQEVSHKLGALRKALKNLE